MTSFTREYAYKGERYASMSMHYNVATGWFRLNFAGDALTDPPNVERLAVEAARERWASTHEAWTARGYRAI